MSELIRTIVAGIADVEGEEPLLRAALGWAKAFRATLHIVHARDAESDRVRAALEDRVRALDGEVPVVCEVVPGRADRALADAARLARAELIVLGATRRGRIGQWLVGTTAQHVVRHAPCPVLVVRSARPRPLRRVLLAGDLTEFSSAVHEHTTRLVDALCGVESPTLRSVFVSPLEGEVPSGERAKLLDWGSAELEAFLWEGALRELPIERRVRLGHPAHEIVAEAREWGADLLVMGTHARKGAGRVLWGSVAEEALPRAQCDVLVVPPGAIYAAAAHLDFGMEVAR
jgi:nucleotide-binding universal stress UspA family protein